MFGKKNKDTGKPTPTPTPSPQKPKKSGFKKGLVTLAFTSAVLGGGFFAGMPIMEGTGVAFRVPANERQVVTWYGGFGLMGYVAKPGMNFKIPGYHDNPITYRVDQQTLRIDRESADANRQITTATADNQLIESVVLDLYYTLNADKIRDIHENAQEYNTIMRDIAVRVHKEVLGDINISNLNIGDSNADSPAQNLTALRDRINDDMTTEFRTAIGETKLAGLVTIEALQLTDFQFTETFRTSIDEVTKEKNRLTEAQATQERVTIEARTAVIQANGERDAAIARATGTSQAIRLEGLARGDALQAEVAPLSGPGADNLIELEERRQWNGQLPSTLVIGGNGQGLDLIIDSRGAANNNDAGETAAITAPAPAPAP